MRIADRSRLCKVCGERHWESAWPGNHVEPRPERSILSSPYVISDTMDATFNPTNNRLYDSKHDFREATKINGGIEIGNDEQKDTRYVDTVTAADIAEAKQMVDQGYRPHSEDATAEQTGAALAGNWENM